MVLTTSTGLIQAKRRQATLERAETLQAALILFVGQNKRLPCPADGTAAQGSATAGQEGARDANQDCVNQTTGTFPYVALGLTEDATLDAWNNRYTYRVASGTTQELTRERGMDMSDCDPSGADNVAPTTMPPRNLACAATCAVRRTCTPIIPPPSPPAATETCTSALSGCTSPNNFLSNKGFFIQDGSTPPVTLANPAGTNPTGAAFILISHGDNSAGAYNSQGIYQAGAGSVGSNETTNMNNRAVQTTYIDAQFNNADTPAHFDDIVLRPTILAVIDRAKLGARVR
jgi:hypothetical protein